jgi:uncharacterized small protein (DUF1192 family)
VSKFPKDSPQIFKNPFSSEFCDFFKCRTVRDRASWIIGQPDPSSLVLPGFIKVCESDIASILGQIPAELLKYVPEVTELQAQVAELQAEIKALKAQKAESSAVSTVAASNNLTCPYCAKTLKNQSGLANHIRFAHPDKV